jgi:hypothetical protein
LGDDFEVVVEEAACCRTKDASLVSWHDPLRCEIYCGKNKQP